MKRSLLVFTLLFSPIFTITSCGCNKNDDDPNDPTKGYCTVTFYTEKGYFMSKGRQTSKTLEIQVKKGETVDRPLDPICDDDNYEFDNWYQDTGTTAIFDFAVPINKSMNLYAGYNFIGEEPFYFEIANGEEIGEGTATIYFSTYDSETNPIHFEEIQYYIGTDYEFAEWTYYAGENTPITFKEGERLYIKSYQTSWNNLKITYQPKGNFDFNVGGNIMSLLNSDDFKNMTAFQAQEVFNGLFLKDNIHHNGNRLKDVSNLKLPATSLTAGCYRSMFAGSDITSTPQAIGGGEIVDYSDVSCYQMFSGCKYLATIQEGFINANNVGSYAFSEMFKDCSELTSIKGLILGSTDAKIGENACERMFYGCTKLNELGDLNELLPSMILDSYCYAEMFTACLALTEISGYLPATTLAPYCYYRMFGNNHGGDIYFIEEYKSNSIKKIENIDILLPATTLAPYCYLEMFASSFDLEEVTGELPATSLAFYCYGSMFADCKKLKTAPHLPYEFKEEDKTEWENWTYCYSYMFYRCIKLEGVEVGFATFPYTYDMSGDEAYNYTTNWLNQNDASCVGVLKWPGTENAEDIPNHNPPVSPVHDRYYDSVSTLPLNWTVIKVV